MITITPLALSKVNQFLNENDLDPAHYGLRVGVQAGGCAGLKYVIALEEPSPTDRIVKYDSVMIIVDPKSYLYLGSSQVDWNSSTLSGGFIINNPEAKRTCGCGTSFI